MELKPETERLVKEEIERGHFRSVDELIVQGVQACEKHQGEPPPPKPRKKLDDLLTQLPVAGSELTIERQRDYPRPAELG